MGSLRAKQGSYIEILKAIQLGQLQGLTLEDRLSEPLVSWLYNAFFVDADLELYLPFNEINGSRCADLSGNRNTGIATGTTIVDGVFGKCRSFDGSVDYITSPGLTGGLTKLTMFMWTKRSATDKAMGMVYHGATGQAELLIFTNSKLYGEIGATTDDWVNHSIAADTNWHFVGLIFDGSKTGNTNRIKLYIDGVLLTPTSEAGTIGAATVDYSSLLIGERDSTGLIDEPHIYTRALSADEMYLHYLVGALKLGLI